MPYDSDALHELLELDFRRGDVGDTEDQWTSRLTLIKSAAEARAVAVPPATDAQIEAGARYLLLSAQIRQLTRQTEELKSASGASVKRDLATLLASVRQDQQLALQASGLALANQRQRQGSMSLPVEVGF